MVEENNSQKIFLQVEGHQVEVTPSMRDYLEKRISKLSHHNRDITGIHIYFEVVKDDQIAKGNIRFRGEKEIHCEAKAPSMYESIDILVDKLDKLVRKDKEKTHRHARVKSKLNKK